MTIAEFAAAVVMYRRRYSASVTRWGSTDSHSVAVGGFAGDPHTWDLGADFAYNSGPNRPLSGGHPRTPHSCPECSDFGLKIIHEDTHDHAQPDDFPAGPTFDYAGQHKAWT